MPGTAVVSRLSCLLCTSTPFTCVLSCVWACVPVQRMARDALCAPRIWNAAEPEMIHPRAFCALLQTRRKRSRVRLPARRWFGEVLLYGTLDGLEPERCAVSVCPNRTPGSSSSHVNLMSHRRTRHTQRSSLTARSRGRIALASRAVSARTASRVESAGSRGAGPWRGVGDAHTTHDTSRSNHTQTHERT